MSKSVVELALPEVRESLLAEKTLSFMFVVNAGLQTIGHKVGAFRTKRPLYRLLSITTRWLLPKHSLSAYKYVGELLLTKYIIVVETGKFLTCLRVEESVFEFLVKPFEHRLKISINSTLLNGPNNLNSTKLHQLRF